MASEEPLSDNLVGFDYSDDLVNAFYYTSGEELEEPLDLDTDEEEDVDFYDLYENLRLTRPPSPLFDEVSSDEESLADEDLDEKRHARYSTSTVKGFVVESVTASETNKKASDLESDGSPQEKTDANPEQNKLPGAREQVL